MFVVVWLERGMSPRALKLRILVAEVELANCILDIRVVSVSFGLATVCSLAMLLLILGAFLMSEFASVLLVVWICFTVVACTCGNSSIKHKSTEKT